jgi:hypothetical protein
MPWPFNISPGFETAMVLALLAIVAALAFCLALVWTQFQRLDAQHKQLRLQLNAQLRDQFAVFNTKLSGQMAKMKRDLEGTEQKLNDTFTRKMEVLDALSVGIKALERRLGRFADTRAASGPLAESKESSPVFEILDGGRKADESGAPGVESGAEHVPGEKTSTGNS